MPTTLNIESFSSINNRERTKLKAGAAVGTQTLAVENAQGFASGDIVYVGLLSREGCERAVVASVGSQTTINLTAPLGLDHSRSEPVASVLGDKIHLYRAVNLDGTAPADSEWPCCVLAGSNAAVVVAIGASAGLVALEALRREPDPTGGVGADRESSSQRSSRSIAALRRVSSCRVFD